MSGQTKDHSFVSRVRGKALGLAKDTQASVLPMMAAALVPTMAMIGGGIDFGRAYLAQSKLQGAVDAGALAAVRAKQNTGNSDAVATGIGKDYIAANFPSGYAGSTLGVEKVEISETNKIVTAKVTASGTVNTTMLRLVGIESLPFQAISTARAAETLPRNVEVMMVLDNTGSMKGKKMKDLKQAATDFVDIVFGESNTREGMAVGIMPYNINVNVGHLVRDLDPSRVVERPDYTNIARTETLAWKGCVFADQTIQNISDDRFTQDVGAFDVTSLLPGEEGMPKVRPYIYPPIKVQSFDKPENQYKVPSNRLGIWAIPELKEALVRRFNDDICTTMDGTSDRKCSEPNTRIDFNRLPSSERNRYSDARVYATSKENAKATGTRSMNGRSPNYVCPAETLPISYSNTRDKLKEFIDEDNEALPNIGTFHTPAMAWAYRMLKRDDFFTRVRPNTKPVNKVLVFMTDGIFDSRDDGRSPGGGGSKIYDTAYTAYGTYEDRKMTTKTSKSATIDELEKRFSKICEAAKSDGIQVYTIAFALNNNDIKDLFQKCATDKNTHFFDAGNGEQLKNAFTTIASELINLRLVK
ncbi:MAG: TadE/TadG family type IV pilus assembly protein [Pseudomonadota bacterium]